ncbi:MAG: response regulator [Desulfovibrionaceae bacterium]
MHILLVDDERDFSAALAERLRMRGMRVSVADDAGQALALLASDCVDMTFVDVCMPGMNGVDLLARIHDSYPQVDVVMLSGANDVSIAVQAMRTGALNWLRKPVTIDDMLQECQHGLERKKQRQQEERLAATAHLHSLGRVAEGVAHEVNNPVNIMAQAAGWVEDLLDDLTAAPSETVLQEMRNALHSIRHQSVRIREITRRLLMFGKGLDAEVRPLCVAAIVRQVMESLQSRADQLGVQIVLNIPDACDPDSPQPVGSTLELYQVCMHCIENALDAMIHGGTLTIFATDLDVHTYELHFVDSGHGIAPDVLPHIFEPFFSTRQVGKGTGLGLAVCQSLLHRRGAAIFVKNHPDSSASGTDMVVQLPLKAILT